jgi:pyruvate,water dikinase
VVDKRDWSVVDINVFAQERQIVRCAIKGTKWVSVPKNKTNKQKLTNKQIIKLAKLCTKIEKHYKAPQDIEWCLADNIFFITQSRPITTLQELA